MCEVYGLDTSFDYKKTVENRFAKGVVVLCGSYDQCLCRKVASCVQI